MLFRKIKSLIVGLFAWVVIGLSVIGGYNVYKYFKPIEITQTENNILRVKLESIGILKVAESQQEYKEILTKGKIFKTIKHIIRTYESFYEYDLKDIEIIEDINNKSVNIIIDLNKLKLTPVRLVKDESFSKSGIISASITEEELNKINEDIYKKVTEIFNNDEEFKNTAIKSLKEKLYNLACEFGYKDINIKIDNKN